MLIHSNIKYIYTYARLARFIEVFRNQKMLCSRRLYRQKTGVDCAAKTSSVRACSTHYTIVIIIRINRVDDDGDICASARQVWRVLTPMLTSCQEHV